MRKIFVLILFSLSLFGKNRCWITYGPHPDEDLIIRYIDQSKPSFFKLQNPNIVESGVTYELAGGYFLHELIFSFKLDQKELRFSCGLDQEILKVARLDLNSSFSFCVAGDIYRDLNLYQKGIKSVATKNPNFVVFGGDLAYSTRGPKMLVTKNGALKRYLTFFDVICEKLITSDGYMIPVLAAIGNHDYEKNVDEYAYQFFFPPNSKTYLHYDFGKKLDLVILDTGHMAPISGLQTTFLDQILKKSSKVFKIAAYHIGAYPSHYGFDSKVAREVRSQFCPVFDRYHLNFAFEHHSHDFKITHPIKNNEINQDGTIYLGDGCFGVKPRVIKNKKAWYIQDAQALNHYYYLSVSDETLSIYPFNFEGELIHSPLVQGFQKHIESAQQTD